jgi:hypothetical protein
VAKHDFLLFSRGDNSTFLKESLRNILFNGALFQLDHGIVLNFVTDGLKKKNKYASSEKPFPHIIKKGASLRILVAAHRGKEKIAMRIRRVAGLA